MRVALEPVKLQFDNVCRFPIRCFRPGRRHIALKNTANAEIFGQIAPFQRTPIAA
jgi:hypothetical protein